MVYEVLLKGRENAITGKEICSILDIKARDLTAAIERERREGKAICASTGSNPGLFHCGKPGGKERYCNCPLSQSRGGIQNPCGLHGND